MRIHKGNLVKRTAGFDSIREPWFCKTGLVLSAPYEEAIHLTTHPITVTSLVLVCDIMIEGNIYSRIPIEHLEKVRSLT